MAKQVKFELEFSEDGKTVVIRLPEGPGQQASAAEIADLTDRLSKALGVVVERHIGDHHHAHSHGHGHGHHHHA